MARIGTVLLTLVFAALALADDAVLLFGVREKDGRLSTVCVTRRGVATLAKEMKGQVAFWDDAGITRFEESGNAVLIRDSSNELNVFHSESNLHHRLDYIVSGVAGLREESGSSESFEWKSPNLRLSINEIMDLAKSHWTSYPYLSKDPVWAVVRRESDWWCGVLSDPMKRDSSVKAMFPLGGPWQSSNKTMLRWETVRSTYVDAIDFTANSKTDIAVIVTKDGVFVHRATPTALKNKVQQISMQIEKVISVQWVTGKDVDKLVRALERKEPKAS